MSNVSQSNTNIKYIITILHNACKLFSTTNSIFLKINLNLNTVVEKKIIIVILSPKKTCLVS